MVKITFLDRQAKIFSLTQFVGNLTFLNACCDRHEASCDRVFSYFNKVVSAYFLMFEKSQDDQFLR